MGYIHNQRGYVGGLLHDEKLIGPTPKPLVEWVLSLKLRFNQLAWVCVCQIKSENRHMGFGLLLVSP